jgi:hypothetical protein
MALSDKSINRMQVEMDAAVLARGQSYAGRTLATHEGKTGASSIFCPLPGRPCSTEFERLCVKSRRNFSHPDKPRDVVEDVWRNPITLAYFIPLIGWIPLAIRVQDNKLRQAKPTAVK